MNLRPHFAAAIAILSLTGCGGSNSASQTNPQGAPRSGKTAVLETGANALQARAPLNQIGIYMVGFHPMHDDTQIQVEAHHYCNQVNEDFAQCVLFDGNTKTANLTGIEYIISEKLFKNLAPGEKKYWHPHNYEVLSGELIAPGLPGSVEKQLMRQKMNSYGKTWHTWMTESNGHPADSVPVGEPHLAWSFNHDNEVLPALRTA